MARSWKFGCIASILVVCGLVSIGMTFSGISSLLGSSRTVTLRCDRNAGTCLLHSGADHTFKLAELRDVQVVSEYSGHEHEWSLVARFNNGAKDLTLGDPSGSSASADEYRRAANEIRSFLSGTSPTLEIQYGVREGTFTIVDNLIYGIFGILLFIVGPIWWLRNKRKLQAVGPLLNSTSPLDAAKREALLKEENVPTWALAQEREIPGWAKAQDMHRAGQISPEQASEIGARLKASTGMPRVFSVAWGVLGAVMLLVSFFVGQAAPALIIAGTISLTFALILQFIVRIRFRGVKAALAAGKVEALQGVVTGAFTFHWRNSALDVLVGINHRGLKMLAPSVHECYSLSHSLQNLAKQKTPVIAYLLPKTNMLVAIEAADGRR